MNLIFCPNCTARDEKYPSIFGDVKRGTVIITPSTEVIINDDVCFTLEIRCKKCNHTSTLQIT